MKHKRKEHNYIISIISSLKKALFAKQSIIAYIKMYKNISYLKNHHLQKKHICIYKKA